MASRTVPKFQFSPEAKVYQEGITILSLLEARCGVQRVGDGGGSVGPAGPLPQKAASLGEDLGLSILFIVIPEKVSSGRPPGFLQRNMHLRCSPQNSWHPTPLPGGAENGRKSQSKGLMESLCTKKGQSGAEAKPSFLPALSQALFSFIPTHKAILAAARQESQQQPSFSSTRVSCLAQSNIRGC